MPFVTGSEQGKNQTCTRPVFVSPTFLSSLTPEDSAPLIFPDSASTAVCIELADGPPDPDIHIPLDRARHRADPKPNGALLRKRKQHQRQPWFSRRQQRKCSAGKCQ